MKKFEPFLVFGAWLYCKVWGIAYSWISWSFEWRIPGLQNLSTWLGQSPRPLGEAGRVGLFTLNLSASRFLLSLLCHTLPKNSLSYFICCSSYLYTPGSEILRGVGSWLQRKTEVSVPVRSWILWWCCHSREFSLNDSLVFRMKENC